MNRSAIFPSPRFAPPRGVTLVELLVTIIIMAILASMVLFAMASAQEAGREAKTKSMIAALDRMILERWESFHTRRRPVALSSQISARAAATLRLDATREIMRRELPDRWTDITSISAANLNTDPYASGVFRAYRRQYDEVVEPKLNAKWSGDAAKMQSNLEQYQGAECLYMIVMFGSGDGDTRIHFSESDVGDTDGDGAPEILDGWGNPISFIRWPAGFRSSGTGSNRIHLSDRQSFQSGNDTTDAQEDHDPFDPMFVQQEAYRLVPLVYSSGPDGDFDIISNQGGATPFDYGANKKTINGTPVYNPYMTIASGKKMGAAHDTDGDGQQEWHDNIHNHLMGQ